MFCLSGHFKTIQYPASISNTIRTNPGTFESVRQSMIRRDYACIHSLEDIFSICCELLLDKRQGFDSSY
jgi:hypothetical protein